MTRALWRTSQVLVIAAVTSLLACGDNLKPAIWSTVASGLRESVLSIAGTSATDVWAVGADRGEGPLVLHFDGAGWTEIETQVRGNLWWLQPFKDGPVFMAGAQSTILRLRQRRVRADGDAGAVAPHDLRPVGRAPR